MVGGRPRRRHYVDHQEKSLLQKKLAFNNGLWRFDRCRHVSGR